MEPWAKFVLAGHRSNSSLNIRLSSAFFVLRHAACFYDASDYDIRRAIMKHATRINLSFIRADQTKQSLRGFGCWPPRSRYDSELIFHRVDSMLLGKAAEKPTPPESYRTQWETITHGWITLHPEPDGLPDREAYFSALWGRMRKSAKEKNLPFPSSEWPRFRPRLLTPDRLGKAAGELPYRCPVCHGSGDREKFYGQWFLDFGRERGISLFCHECSELAAERRWLIKRKQEDANRIHTPQRISAGVAQRALKDLGITVPKKTAGKAIHQLLKQPGDHHA